MPDALDQRALPTGTVTFLRTDVEGSVSLARHLGVRWDRFNVEHLGTVLAAALERGRRLSLDDAIDLMVEIETGLPSGADA